MEIKSKIKTSIVKSIETSLKVKSTSSKKEKINYEKSFKKIALISTKPLGIGDLIMATPFIKSLREAYPKAKIHLITDKDIFDKVEEIDEIKIVKGSLLELNNEFENLSSQNYDLSIIMQRAVNQYMYAKKLNSKYILGYFEGFNISSNFKLKNKTQKFTKKEHFSYMSLKIGRTLGIKEKTTLIKPKYSKEINEKAKYIFNSLNLDKNKKTICINPFVLWETRRWDENYYIELIKRLNKKFNFVLYGGPDSIQISNYIENQLRNKGIPISNVSGKMKLKKSICFLKYIDLFLTGDCGPMHFSLMMRRPTLAFFGPIDPRHRLPIKKEKYFDYLWAKDYVENISMYNYESKHDDKKLEGLRMISVDEVERKILKFFKEGGF